MKSLGNSTQEWKANKYLSTCHTDLGTIRRALLELKDEGLIRKSNHNTKNKYQEIEDIETNEGLVGENAKNPKRLDDPDNELKCNPKYKIGTIRIYITLKGLDYIRNYERFLDEDELNQTLKYTSKTNATSSLKMKKYTKSTKKFTRWIAVATIISVLVSISNILLECNQQPKDILKVQLQPLQNNKKEIVIHDTLFVKNVSEVLPIVKN